MLRAFPCSVVEENLPTIQEVAAGTTRYGKLVNVRCYQVGRQVIVNFGFHTADAQGMNMIVRATDAICQWIRENYAISSYFLFSGMCSEKRGSGFLLTRGKGKRVTAGALLTHDVLRLYLHTTANDLFRVWQSTVIGHLQAGCAGLQLQRPCQRTHRHLHRDRPGRRQRGGTSEAGPHPVRTPTC